MRPKAILRLLESVANQKLYPDEILVIDGSTDFATQNIFDEKVFKNLTYFKVEKSNRGLTKQRNFGITKVSETIDIVCFLDDDTILKHGYFENLINTYIVYPKALAVGGYITNEVTWKKSTKDKTIHDFEYDGWLRKESSRFILRKKLGLVDDTPPGYMPIFSNGRSVSFLPPSGKIYPVEQLMGGVSSFKKNVFEEQQFSTYFEGYGLYEDADFSLRLAKKGSLYVNTAAQLEHHHHPEGRPNKFKYGVMVIRNGWYVWRVKYPKPSLKARFKWNAIAFLLTLIRFGNVITTSERKSALTEALGRKYGWCSLLFNKPKLQR
jgi:GT2 family glycosyltransferase